MRRRLLRIGSRLLVIVALLGLVGGSMAGLRLVTAEGVVESELIPDLGTLLDYPHNVHIEPLGGVARDAVLGRLTQRDELGALMAAMADKGFTFDFVQAEVMRIEIAKGDGTTLVVEGLTVSTIANELSAALTAMVAEDGTAFFQAHHTNLDPRLAGVPDPPIVVNGMPYFYITALRWVNGRIIYWRYWWYDSHHHPNWYYAHYYWYWWYYDWYTVDWPYWYGWVHGWYYWRYWYYWSTWFPW